MSEPRLLKDVPLSQRIITEESKSTEEISESQYPILREPKFKIGDKITCGDGMPWTVAKINALDTSVWFSGSYFEYMVDGEPSYYDQGSTPFTYFLEEDIELYIESEPSLPITEEIPLSKVIACSCGHEAFSLDIVEDYVYLRLYYNQRALRRIVFERIRNAWYMLIGKEYKVVELVFPIGEIKKQFEDFLSKLH